MSETRRLEIDIDCCGECPYISVAPGLGFFCRELESMPRIEDNADILDECPLPKAITLGPVPYDDAITKNQESAAPSEHVLDAAFLCAKPEMLAAIHESAEELRKQRIWANTVLVDTLSKLSKLVDRHNEPVPISRFRDGREPGV